MSDLFYIWLATGVFFFLIEMLTATLYGLSISIAGFTLALYVYFSGDTTVTLIQGIILAAMSALFAYVLPKWLKPSKSEDFKSGLDVHIWQRFHLERVGNDWKTKIDGVDYLIDEYCVTPDFEVGKKVQLDAHKSGILTVSVVK